LLQAMRASAKYIWIIIVILFVGGFLLAETSGLLGRAPVTTTTAVAKVNGEDILATSWYQVTQNLEQEASQRSSQSISLDERARLQDQGFARSTGAAASQLQTTKFFKRHGTVRLRN
jgi:peptidyl-prolyl cis-trans isomerase D